MKQILVGTVTNGTIKLRKHERKTPNRLLYLATSDPGLLDHLLNMRLPPAISGNLGPLVYLIGVPVIFSKCLKKNQVSGYRNMGSGHRK